MVKEVESVLRVGRELAEHVTGASYGELPSEVAHQAKRVMLDSLGTIYMGARKGEAAGVDRFLSFLGEPEECTVIGTGRKTSMPWAAWANAAYAQVHDCNDGHREAAALGGSSHPGRVAVPTALAVGEKMHASGRDVVTAIAVGYDVAAKVKVSPDEGLDSVYPEGSRPTTVEVKLRDGAAYRERVDTPWGEPRNPLTDEELFDKFMDWSSPTVDKEKAERIWSALRGLDELGDVSELMPLL